MIGFYGFPGTGGRYSDDGPTQVAGRLEAPVIGLMGGADPGSPASEIDAFKAALAAAQVEHEVVVYPRAPYSFFDRKQAEFGGESADAWQRVLDFLLRHGAVPG